MPPRLFHVKSQKTHTEDITAMCGGKRSGKVYASGALDKILYLWSVEYDTPVIKFGPFPSEVTALSFNRSEDAIAVGTHDGTISLIDLDNNEIVYSWKIDKKVTAIEMHPRLPYSVFVGDESGRMFFFSHPKTEPLATISTHSSKINCITTSTIHGLIGTCSDDKTIRLFDLNSYKSLGVIRSNLSSVTGVAFHPTEKILASCSTDRYIKMFELNKSYEMDGSFIIGRSPPTSIAFSHDGTCAVACSPSGLSIIKVKDTKFSDHMTFSLSNTYTLCVFSTGIAITSSYGSNAKYVLLDANDFPLLKPHEVRQPSPSHAPYQVISRDCSVPVHIFDQSVFPDGQRLPARKMQSHFHEKFLAEIQLNKKMPPPTLSDPMIYKEFSTDRKSYMETILNRLKKLNAIKDTIKRKGTDEAIAIYSSEGGSEEELISMLEGRQQTIHIGNAANLLNIGFHALTKNESDEARDLKYIDEVLTIVAPIVRVSLTEPNSIEIMNVMHRNSGKLSSIASSESSAAQIANKILNDYDDLV